MPVTEVFAAFVTTAGLLAGGEKAKTALEGEKK